MKQMTFNQMIALQGSRKANNCDTVTGALCSATVLLAFSTVFSPLAAATGIGCGLGVYAGCTQMN